MTIRHMFKPIVLGQVEVPNRIVRTAHGTDIGKYRVSPDLIAYHEARAKGGVGLSILETLSADEATSPSHLKMTDPDLIPGYQRLMKAVKPYGMRVLQQIWHGGHNAHIKDGSPSLSASNRPGMNDGIPCIPMTKADIDRVVKGFGDCAATVEEGGLNGVEVHGAHGYLLQQFLSPLHNKRTDEYGGSLENRARLMLETLREVRKRVSKDFIVGVRLSPEAMPGGTTAEECVYALEMLQAENLIDYVSLSLGNYYTLHKIIGAMHEPLGYQIPADAAIAAAAKVPKLITGRFRTLEEADQVIGRGEADLVGMTRAHIADPDIVRKTREGREDEVRPCIGCNQGCLAGQLEVGHLACTVNVAVGEELSLAEDLITKAETPKKVLVVGGGPAGLEAARVAALRGHKVILAEATPDLGGTLNIARRAPRRQAIGDIADWQTREVYRLGVEVRLSTYMSGEDVKAENPDAVILATGSTPWITGYQTYAPNDVPAGIDLPNVVTSTDVVQGGAQPSNGTAVVFDGVGHYEAVAAAEALIEKGHKVIFVTGHKSFIPKMDFTFSVEPALERLSRHGRFRLLTRHRILEVTPKSVSVAPLYAPQQVEEFDASMLVFVEQNTSNTELLEELTDYDCKVIPVGDAKSPRFLRLAIREGHLAARNI